jgi:hypothetical protein
MHVRGRRMVLGGLKPVDPHWLRMLCQQSVLRDVDVIRDSKSPI